MRRCYRCDPPLPGVSMIVTPRRSLGDRGHDRAGRDPRRARRLVPDLRAGAAGRDRSKPRIPGSAAFNAMCGMDAPHLRGQGRGRWRRSMIGRGTTEPLGVGWRSCTCAPCGFRRRGEAMGLLSFRFSGLPIAVQGSSTISMVGRTPGSPKRSARPHCVQHQLPPRKSPCRHEPKTVARRDSPAPRRL